MFDNNKYNRSLKVSNIYAICSTLSASENLIQTNVGFRSFFASPYAIMFVIFDDKRYIASGEFLRKMPAKNVF
jgi:hypothetical protein